jgi:FdhE protein
VTGPANSGPAETSTRDGPEDPLERRLRALVLEFPDLAEAADVYRVTLPLLRDAGPIAAPVALTEEQARKKISAGEPLLHGATLVFDPRAARELMLRLARGLEGAGLAGIAPVRQALEDDRLTPGDLLAHAADGDYPSVAARADEQTLSPPLLWTLAQSALKPALRAWCRQLSPLVHNAGGWERSDCFLCGAAASLGELQGNGQSKHLRCGPCGADWPFRRLRCTHCGNEDTASLGILYPEGRRDKVRVEVCDKCRGYLKVVSNFEPASPEELAIEDLSTLYLDDYAQRQGYLRPQIRQGGL